MLQVTHIVSSALIATKVEPAAISFPLIIATHYLMDAVPHWDTGTDFDPKDPKSKRKAVIATLLDQTIALLIVWFAFQAGKPLSWVLWAGILLGIMPDIINAPALFLNYHPWLIEKLGRFHRGLHRQKVSKVWGITYQAGIVLVALLLNKLL